MAEFYNWSAYERIEPFGDYWGLWQNALMLACVINFARGSKSGRQAKPEDFMPQQRSQPTKQTPQEAKAIFKAFAKAHNAAMQRKAG